MYRRRVSTKTAKRTKAAPRTRKSTAPAGAKHANASPLPVPNLAPGAVVIPSSDPLMGAQFNANVNCKTHTIAKGKRKGKAVRRCDRQRLTVVGGATPSSDHPKRKQVFAVQVGSRFTIPDREIRRDLSGSGRERVGASCDTYRERVIEGQSVPARAYDACPGLDAVEAHGGGDTSFEFKTNGRKRNGAGIATPFGSHEAPVDVVRGYLAQHGVRPLLRDLGGGRVLVTPSRSTLAADFDATKLMKALSYKRFHNHEFRIDPYPATTGSRVVVFVSLVPERQLLAEARDDEKRRRQIERMTRKPNHHGGYHAPGDPLGVYLPPPSEWREAHIEGGPSAIVWIHPHLRWQFWLYRDGSGAVIIPRDHAQNRTFTSANGDVYAQMKRWYASQRLGFTKPNRAPRDAVAGQTYADSREDDLTGRRVSGERYAGEVRGRAVGCDGKTPSHIVGGHIVPRSRVASAVRRETKEMDKQIRAAAFKSRYGTFDAPQSMAVYDADEGLARMAEIEAAPEARALVRRAFDEVYPESAPAPLQLGPGPSFGAGEIEPLRPSARAHERFRGRFGAGTAEELRPRPATTTAAVSDADLAAMFMEEAAKLGLVKQNRRFHAARYPTRRR